MIAQTKLEHVEQSPSGLLIKFKGSPEVHLSDRTSWFLAMRILTEMRNKHAISSPPADAEEAEQ